MKNHKIILALLCTITSFISSNVIAQNNDESLLWEITGNDLTKPSYLYGTIHVQDKRVFNLPDSVIIAIENCEAFSGEVNMDSIYSQMFQYLSKKKYTGRKLKELLTAEEYKQLNRKAKSVLKKSLDDLNTDDPRFIAFTFESEEIQKDVPYSLDEYLYRIAKKNNKIITSVEKIEDQLKIFDSFDEETTREFLLKIIEDEESDIEELVIAYSENDLPKINDLINYFESEYEELANVLLYNRNIKMAASINAIVKQNPVFIAIGAGHLSGERGVISLLRNYGYNVRPVFSENKKLFEKYSIEDIELPWNTYSSSSGGFEVRVPGTQYPVPIKDFIPGISINAAMYFDVQYQMVYLIMDYESQMKIIELKDSLAKTIIENLSKKNRDSVITKPIIGADILPGLEFETNLDGTNARVHLFTRENHMYMLLVSSSKDSAGIENGNRFFNSLKLNKLQPVKDKAWKSSHDETSGFKVLLPGEPLKQLINENTVVYTAANDSIEHVYYAFCIDYQPELQTYLDASIIDRIIKRYESNDKAKILSRVDLTSSNYTYIEFSFILKNEFCKARAYPRGNRLYLMLECCDVNVDDTTATVKFFDSFEFLEFQPPVWSNFSDSLKEFSVDFPTEQVVKDPSEQVSFTSFTSKDKNSGISYFITKSIMSDYYQADSSFYVEQFPDLKDSSTIILSDTVYTSGKLIVKDYVLKGSDPYNIFRLRVYISGNILYSLQVSSPEQILFSERVNHFFDSFKILKENDFDIYADKSQKFFGDLVSKDKEKKDAAINGVSNFSFKESHLDKIYELLEQEFDDDGTTGVRTTLLEGLKKIESDTKIDFIRKIYNELPDNPSMLITALEVLAEMKTENSTTAFGDLILSRTPETENVNYSLFYSFYDSLSLLKCIFPRLLELTQNENYTYPVFALLSNGLDENILDPLILNDYENQIAKNFTEEVTKNKKRKNSAEDEDYNWTLSKLLEIVPYLKNNESIKNLLVDLSSDEDITIACDAALGLIKMGNTVPEEKLYLYASNIKTRNKLYSGLEKCNQQKQFPTEFLTQELFAEGDLFKWVNEDYDFPDSMVLVDSRETISGNYFLFKFRIEEGDNKNWYAGISGPQPVDTLLVLATAENTVTEYELFDDKTIEEHWNELLDEKIAENKLE